MSALELAHAHQMLQQLSGQPGLMLPIHSMPQIQLPLGDGLTTQSLSLEIGPPPPLISAAELSQLHHVHPHHQQHEHSHHHQHQQHQMQLEQHLQALHGHSHPSHTLSPQQSGSKEACTHGPKSYCCWGKLSQEERERITDDWRRLDKKDKLHRINLCIKPTETLKKRVSEIPQKKRFQSKYYIKPPRLLSDNKDEYRCCRQTFSYLTEESLRTVDRQAAIVATSGDLLKPRNHGGLRKPCCQNSSEPVSEETWNDLERWIQEKVPRHQAQEDGVTIWIVGDPTDDQQQRLCHRTLLAALNDTRRAEGKHEIKLWMWKRAWYERLQLKGKWKFR